MSDNEIPVENKNEYFEAWTDDQKYNVKHHLAWALSLFRMRVRLVQESDALVVVGGKDGKADDGSTRRTVRMPWGRFPGVAEEVMLAQALNKPVYIIGLAGGAAEAVGNIMGLARTPSDISTWLPEPTDSDYKTFCKKLQGETHRFDIPKLPDLPKTLGDLKKYLFGKTPGTSKWAPNGLTLEENVKLFNYRGAENIQKCIDLLMEGISRLNWQHE